MSQLSPVPRQPLRNGNRSSGISPLRPKSIIPSSQSGDDTLKVDDAIDGEPMEQENYLKVISFL